MWIKKYAPQQYDHVRGNPMIVKRFEQMSKTQYIQHMILYGPPGVGKNTVLKLLIQKLFGETYRDATMIFSSYDNKNNQTIREKIHQFAPIQISSCNKKIIVFKQAEQLSSGSQQIMRRLMEKYYHHTTFIFVCNSLNNLIETIQSRCHIFYFKPIPITEQMKHLSWIAQQEHIGVGNDETSSNQEHNNNNNPIFEKITHMSHGDLRFSVNYFQTICNTLPLNNGVKQFNKQCMFIQKCFFPYYDDIIELFSILLQTDKTIEHFLQCIAIIQRIHSYGYCGLDITFFLSHYIIHHPLLPEGISVQWLKHIAICEDKLNQGVISNLQLITLVSKLYHTTTI